MKTHAAPQVSSIQFPVSNTDHSLLLQRLEKLLAENPDAPQAAEILSRETVWKRLEPKDAVRWARLAQAAGLIDVSLQVLAWMTEAHPDFTEAWQVRTELLEILGRKPEGRKLPGERPAEQSEGDKLDESATAEGPSPEDLEAGDSREDLAGPFFSMRRQEQLIGCFLDLFHGREDCFARQWADRRAGTQGYVPVRRPLEMADALDHIQGHRTYGIYLLQRDSRVRLAVVDADLVSSLRSSTITAQERNKLNREKSYLLQRLPELSRERGLPCLAEFSGGKGFHFWYFFTEPVSAALARSVLQGLCKMLAADLGCFNLEVFPKQDHLAGKGLGNLVKLPLGVHRATGKPSFFVHLHDRSPNAQLGALQKVRKISSEVLEAAAGPSARGQVLVHPRHQAWADEFPELAVLSEKCAALGQIMAGCRQSRTLSLREEKVLYGTLGFLPRAKTVLHHLFQDLPDYNPHLIEYRLSRLRGTPLGCKRIHSLLEMTLDHCRFPDATSYPHPLLHWPEWSPDAILPKAERVSNLQDALDGLKEAIHIVERFLPKAG
jgi:hypothetical protein